MHDACAHINGRQHHGRKIFAAIFAFLLLWALPGSAHGQMAERPPNAPADLSVSDSLEVLASYDLSAMSENWWDRLVNDVDEGLQEEGVRESAMAKAIYLGTYYPDKVDLDVLTSELYNIYRFDERRDFRIMALAALYSIGDENAMRMLADRGGPFLTYAPWESDKLVRQLTATAVAQYFLEGQVEVGEPEVVPGTSER